MKWIKVKIDYFSDELNQTKENLINILSEIGIKQIEVSDFFTDNSLDYNVNFKKQSDVWSMTGYIIDNRFATKLSTGTASALNYASRLYLLPIGVFAISLSVVIFPTLSQAVVKNERKKVKRVVEQGLNMLSFLIVPSTVILYGYAREIVTLIYKRGNFSDKNVIVTTETLQFYALGLLFFSTIHLLTRSHYVYKDRTIPVISSFISIGCNILLDNLLYKQYAHKGLTFATSFAAFVNFTIFMLI